MQVIQIGKRYRNDPSKYLHFEDYSKQCGNFVFVQDGFSKDINWNDFTSLFADKKNLKILRLELEEPNKFFIGDNSDSYDDKFYRIFTICPYTADWLNKKYNTHKRIPVFFPFNERYIPKKAKKNIDVIYSGHIVSSKLKKELLELTAFNYALISNSNSTLVTHKSISYEEKMELYAKSKITLVHNILFKPYIHRIITLWMCGDFWENKAFSKVPRPWKPWELFKSNIYIPQLKSRVFEAAFSRSLILCQKDDFNVIERYFEPNREFVYYQPGSLSSTIQEILNNYSKYQKIIDNAYIKAKREYTVNAFVKKYLTTI